MSEIELPVPDVQQEVEFTRALLTDGGCYTAEQVRQIIAAERERAAKNVSDLVEMIEALRAVVHRGRDTRGNRVIDEKIAAIRRG